jgi:hypothetical protein
MIYTSAPRVNSNVETFLVRQTHLFVWHKHYASVLAPSESRSVNSSSWLEAYGAALTQRFSARRML